MLFKKILSTDWTFNLTNHSLTYEYRANEPVTSIEYQTMVIKIFKFEVNREI